MQNLFGKARRSQGTLALLPHSKTVRGSIPRPEALLCVGFEAPAFVSVWVPPDLSAFLPQNMFIQHIGNRYLAKGVKIVLFSTKNLGIITASPAPLPL